VRPEWLRVDLPCGEEYDSMVRLLKSTGLNTVCQAAHCPNISECFSSGTAAFMLLGDVCTRDCLYCDVPPGVPMPPDPDEPARVAQACKKLGLHYVVVTSVTRDDLPDSGASHFAQTIREIRSLNPQCKVEVLIPDLKGDVSSLKKILAASPDILNHNLETVSRLFPEVRPQGDYQRSLDLLTAAASFDATTKSGLMVGMGETEEEIRRALKDLREADVASVTIGQYLQPSTDHVLVSKYYSPEEFSSFKDYCMGLGFSSAYCSPLVRSSYHASEVYVGH